MIVCRNSKGRWTIHSCTKMSLTQKQKFKIRFFHVEKTDFVVQSSKCVCWLLEMLKITKDHLTKALLVGTLIVSHTYANSEICCGKGGVEAHTYSVRG